VSPRVMGASWMGRPPLNSHGSPVAHNILLHIRKFLSAVLIIHALCNHCSVQPSLTCPPSHVYTVAYS
jgi:hypothetical protein